MMVRRFILLLFTLLLLSCSQQPDVYDINNTPVYFSKLNDQWLLINYWADWCEPCLKEMPALDQFAKEEEGKVAVFGVNFDGATPKQQIGWVERLNITYPLLQKNPGTLLKLPEVKVLPTSFLVSPDRKKIITLIGPQTLSSLSKAFSSNKVTPKA